MCSCKRYLAGLLLLLPWLVFPNNLPGQDLTNVTVLLLNAKSGKPMLKQNVTILWLGKSRIEPSVSMVDTNGKALFTIPAGATSFFLQEGPRVGKEPGRVAYLDCNKAAITPGPIQFQVSDVIKTGVVPGNACSKKSFSPQAGLIVFWAEGRGPIDMQ